MVGFAQEFQAGNIVDSLKKTLALRALVVRNSCMVEINAEEVVIGDIIHVEDVSSWRSEKRKKKGAEANIPFREQSSQQMGGWHVTTPTFRLISLESQGNLSPWISTKMILSLPRR